MSFQQGLSGLSGASKALDTIGNNIANSGTAGFKGASARFADVFAASLQGGSGNQVGVGVGLNSVFQSFTQGNVTSTGNSLDLAINGGGFFRMIDDGSISFTRNGQFNLDKDGFVVNGDGRRLTGYGVDSSGNVVPGNFIDLQVESGNIAPLATTSSEVQLTLDSRAAAINIPFDPTDATSYTASTAQTAFDSLGNAHNLTMYFVKSVTLGEYDMYAVLDVGLTDPPNDPTGVSLQLPLPGGPFVASTLAFDTKGVLATVDGVASPLSVAQSFALANGADPLAFDLDFAGTTQYGVGFAVNKLTQDGYTSGRLTGINVGADGILLGRYSNGKSQNLGQVALSNFANPNGLQSLGNNLWAETSESGQPIPGTPGQGSLGVIQSGSIEESNVDLTAELVSMITQQRAYQANAQSIKTQDSVLQTLVNLR